MQEFTTTTKVSEPKADAHKVAGELKGKWTTKEFGGIVTEFKVKNNGECTSDNKFDCLKVSLQNIELAKMGERILRKNGLLILSF